MTATLKDRFWRRVRQLFAVFGLMSAVVLLAGFFGGFHPALDTVALLRPLAFVATAIFLFAFKSGISRFLTALMCGVALASMAVTLLPGGSVEPDITVYSKNILTVNENTDALVADILAADANVVFLQEVSVQNQSVITDLGAAYPHQHRCVFGGRFDIAILSSVALETDLRCSDERAAAAARINWQGQQIWLVSAHVHWHWPFGNSDAEATLLDFLSTLYGKVVMVGDFNSFGWTARISRLSEGTRAQRAGPNLPTLLVKGVPLPVDMAFAPGGGRIERRGYFGSDHRGIVAHLSLSR